MSDLYWPNRGARFDPGDPDVEDELCILCFRNAYDCVCHECDVCECAGASRMATGEVKPIWSGEFTFGGMTMKCHTLANGERVIEAESIATFLEWIEGGPWIHPEDQGLRDFTQWQKGAVGLGVDKKLIEK